MQLGDLSSALDTSSGEAVMAAVTTAKAPPPQREVTVGGGGVKGGGGGGGIMIGMDPHPTTTAATSGEEKDEKNMNSGSGANRWPRQETLALLKIRSAMGAAFRDSSLKGPLWEEVSRKLAELGYHRSAKKCKEKFENVYKYHKRTKDSRSGKPEGKTKTYRFSDELQALETRFTHTHSHSLPQKPQPCNLATTNTLSSMPLQFPKSRPTEYSSTTISYITTTTATTTVPPTNNPPLPNTNLSVATTATSSSTASDENLEERYRKKRKWKDYFRRLTRQVLARQEEMHKRFLEAIDKRERERVAQQETWRMQEMAPINREHEILVQERSTAAATDAAVIAFLQRLSGGGAQQPPPHPPPPHPTSQLQYSQQQQTQQPQLAMMPNANCEKFETEKMNNNNHSTSNGGGASRSSSSRWPKAEVQSLIRLRTSLEGKYQENGPKAPLWEEISSGMQRLGYNRSNKRCKEKWENINKYFKKIKESNKQRREDSKTCPYFDELDALYKEKSKILNNPFGPNNMEPLMVEPEQQWRPPGTITQYEQQQQQMGEEEEDVDDGGEDGGIVEEVEGGDGGYENINNMTNKLSSVDTVE